MHISNTQLQISTAWQDETQARLLHCKTKLKLGSKSQVSLFLDKIPVETRNIFS